MRVLMIGGGGREHTLIWKIAQSPLVDKIYCTPGNAGISEIAECAKMDVEGPLEPMAQFAMDNKIDLTLVGPEDPLANGIVDYFESLGLRVFGPSKAAAEIEASKVFCKELMNKYGIPTAKSETFDDPEEAKTYIREVGAPIVVKADGLAKGKGVIVCHELQEALDAVNTIMVQLEHGDAGIKILVEECLKGEEVSFIAFTDGKTIVPMESAQDYKPKYPGGPNTGGMGAYSPAPVVTDEVYDLVMESVMKPTIAGMAAEGRTFKGVLYAGLMIINGKPYVIEFNARLGDPETQVILPRLKSDIIPVIEACIDERLDQIPLLKWTDGSGVCVVMVSGGYPTKYEKGKLITGVEAAQAMEGVEIFHAGTTFDNQGRLVTDGGRVLGVTALGGDIQAAINAAYEAVSKLHFDGAYCRGDIGRRALNR